MIFKLPWGEKQMFWALKNRILHLFFHKCLNPKLAEGNIWENGFQATFGWKTNVLNVFKLYFSLICKLLSGEVETVEILGKQGKAFKII